MGTFFQTLLGSPAGSFAFIFSLFVIIVVGVWYITKNITKIKSEHGVISNSFEKMEKNIDDIRRDLSYLKGNVDCINSGKTALAQSHSPITLSEKGQEVSKELDAVSLVANNWEAIFNNLEQNVANKNAYDIQQYCIETASVELDKFLNEQDLLKVKNFAFNQGANVQYFSIVFALIIRDKYFKDKKIKISDIDVHAPQK
jgi:hypothetical protein